MQVKLATANWGVALSMLNNNLKSRKIAAILAFAGTFLPTPLTGLHKFYVGQPWWGLLYMLLSWTPIPRVASAIEGVWYLSQDGDEFDRNFNQKLEMASGSPVFSPNANAGDGVVGGQR